MIKACCGAGKTRVLIGAALEDKSRKAMILSFNRALAEETSEKVKDYDHIEVYNIHSLASVLYGKPVPDNRTLQSLLSDDFKETPDIGLLCVDEIQDVFTVQIEFIALLVKAIECKMKVAPDLLLVGDSAQMLYEFMYGNQPSLFSTYRALSDLRWKKMQLTQTQRLTPEIVTLVNRFFRHPDDDAIVSAKAPTGVLPRVVIGNDSHLIELVDELLLTTAPGDLMINCYTLKSTFIAIVEAHLVSKGVPVHNTMYPQPVIEKDVEAQGKVILTTYHRAKGLERKTVLVVGLTASYWLMNDRPTDADGLPVTTAPGHVAVTRAMERLYMFCHAYQGLYPTVPSVSELRKCATVTVHQNPAKLTTLIDRDDERRSKPKASGMLFEYFAQWSKDGTMDRFAADVVKGETAWWGGSEGKDDWGFAKTDENEQKLIELFDAETIGMAVAILCSNFEAQVIDSLSSSIKQGARFRKYHDFWNWQIKRVKYPWDSDKSGLMALSCAIMGTSQHAIRVGGISTKMQEWASLPNKARLAAAAGLTSICRKIVSDVGGPSHIDTVCTAKGTVDVMANGRPIMFTTCTPDHLAEGALRRIAWGLMFNDDMDLYFLDNYTKITYTAKNFDEHAEALNA